MIHSLRYPRSSDYGKFVPTQSQPALPIAYHDQYQQVGNTTIGPSFYSLFKNFPGAKYIFQVPLATKDLASSIEWTKAGIESIGIDNILAIEIGNEPNLYNGQFDGQPKLTNET